MTNATHFVGPSLIDDACSASTENRDESDSSVTIETSSLVQVMDLNVLESLGGSSKLEGIGVLRLN